jgi:transposase InsO family protein
LRDQIIKFVFYWSERTELPLSKLLGWIGLSRSKFDAWRKREGKDNRHNGKQPRDGWLLEWEKKAIISFYQQHREEGYRRVAYMMLDANIVAVSPSSVYRVLKQAGELRAWSRKDSKKGTGFEQPTAAHQHWHVDIAFINIRSTFFYLCSILDGWSRYIVHWELKAHITELDLEIILLRAKEIFPGANPRIISDNGPQFIARDFKEFIRLMEMTHVRTSPYYPQSNGKIERYHRSIKSECIRPATPLSVEDGLSSVAGYVGHYNTVRLHSAIGYITPVDKLHSRDQTIFAERKAKLLAARSARIANPPLAP